MSSEITSIVLAGVGGQGILLASDITALAAMNAGYDVKTNEVHGMAQRGGSVIGQIRYGKKVYSPLVTKGTAKVLAGLERIEILRYADYLAKDGLAVVNSQMIIPVTVSMGVSKYPSDAKELLAKIFPKLVYFDAGEEAAKLGNIKAANVVLLGTISNGVNLPIEAWIEAITKRIPEKFLDLNIKAFNIGRNIKK
ncbi:MAG: indolepyruvate oxidoreductase subunit beta [Candidatus Omnitrophica bacterium]|nr:indolepyruvate oxidoreductase subunit beta [Candidatus Omnitrophota bacterium]